MTRGKGAHPVTVRSMNNPKPGWTLEAALDLIAQGYSAEHAERVSGYAARHLIAVTRAAARSAAHDGVPKQRNA